MTDPNEREETVFEAALALHGAERAAYLDQACAGDPGLRGRIEGLLGALDRAGGLLAAPAIPREPITPDLKPVPTARPGDRIGPYKLLQQIGEGGFGVVYMAEQLEPVRRHVALKIIKLGMDTKQVAARFEAERQALALMDHPNIAKVFDAGATATGRPYFVMELVRGLRITDYCDENELPMRQRLELFIQVCQAVQHAHQKGIIHRDLKPSNILVTVDDPAAPGCPKVIDFGIAKATSGQQLTDKTLFTAFEQFMGTPAYMSPEQALMTSLDVDTRTDVYSLGVLLYELLTGKTPFDAKDLLQAGFDEMRRTIRETEPARPSTRLSTMVPSELTTAAERRRLEAPKLIHLVRGDLDWIVMKCLEKDRARRYETANGLARDIHRYLWHEPVVARPPHALYRFQKSVRRNKTAYAAVAAVALALLMGVIVSTSQAVRAKRAELVAEGKKKNSEQVAKILKDMLTSVDPAVARGRDRSLLREILDETAGRVGQGLDDLPEVEAELRQTFGDVYQLLGEYEKAEAMYRPALVLRRTLLGPAHPVVAQLLSNLGVTLMSQDKSAEAEACYREALAMRRKLPGPKRLEVAETLSNLAFLLRREGRLAEAEAAIRESLAIRMDLLGREHRAVADSLQGLATIQWRQGLLQDAETTLREGLAMQTRLLGNWHPRVADMTEDLGLILADQGRHTEAEQALREAVASLRKLLGDTHPDTTTCIVMLLNNLLTQEKYVEAEPLARECLATREQQMPDDPRAFSARSVLGACLLGQKRYAEAEPLLLSGYEGIKRRESRIPWEGRYVVTNALNRIVQLYQATRQADKEAEWRARLSGSDVGRE